MSSFCKQAADALGRHTDFANIVEPGIVASVHCEGDGAVCPGGTHLVDHTGSRLDARGACKSPFSLN